MASRGQTRAKKLNNARGLFLYHRYSDRVTKTNQKQFYGSKRAVKAIQRVNKFKG